MARSISLTLTRMSILSPTPTPPFPHPPRFLTLRSQSKQSTVHDLDFDAVDSSSTTATTDPDVLAFRKIEDAIHSINVRRSAPDWLPFVPGASYWVPPRDRSRGMDELFGKFVHKLSDDEAMSLTTERGWPSTSYYAKDAYTHQLKWEASPDTYLSEDEE